MKAIGSQTRTRAVKISSSYHYIKLAETGIPSTRSCFLGNSGWSFSAIAPRSLYGEAIEVDVEARLMSLLPGSVPLYPVCILTHNVVDNWCNGLPEPMTNRWNYRDSTSIYGMHRR